MLLKWQSEILRIIKGRASIGLPTTILLEGPPGSSKTWFAEEAARIFGAPLFEFRCTSTMKAEDVLYSVAISAGNQVQYVSSPILNGFEKSGEGKVVILIDEIDKARPRVEELLLRGLETWKFFDIFGKEVAANPANIVLVATSNRMRELMLPTYRRFTIRLEVSFPSKAIQMAIVRELLPDSIVASDAVISILVNEAEELRELDAAMAASYKELAELIVTLSFVTDVEVAKDIAGRVMWKGDEYPHSLKWVSSLLKAIKNSA